MFRGAPPVSLLAIVVLLGCAGQQGGEGGPNSAAAAAPDRISRLSLFQDLVARVRRFHTMAPAAFQGLGRRWEDDLPGLQAELERAEGMPAVMRALRHFGNSLRDPHCKYHEPDPFPSATAGITLAVEWLDGRPQYYVDRIDEGSLSGKVEEGDQLLEVDGVPAGQLLTRLSLESNRNSWFGISRDVARYLGRRPIYDLPPGRASSSWLFRGRSSGLTYRLETPWKKPSPQDDTTASAPLDEDPCPADSGSTYGSYQLHARGFGVCVYLSDRGTERYFPIVRQHTFLYAVGDDPAVARRNLQADQRILRRTLGRVAGLRGVVLDLRQNQGGNNPNWFLDWWAPASYTDHFVYYRVHPELVQADGSISFISHEEVAADYFRLARGISPHASGGDHYTRGWPAFCPSSTRCQWSNRYRPRSRVTDGPVALLVGPDCLSSCDSVAQIFAENDFGPVIGEPTSAGYTFARKHLPLTVRDVDLGLLTVAVSFELSGKTGRRIEAVPIDLDSTIPRLFSNHDRYGRLLVEAAQQALRRPRLASRLR